MSYSSAKALALTVKNSTTEAGLAQLADAIDTLARAIQKDVQKIEREIEQLKRKIK
jgi:hypothetical protein